jgi:hypothetical protein
VDVEVEVEREVEVEVYSCMVVLLSKTRIANDRNFKRDCEKYERQE